MSALNFYKICRLCMCEKDNLINIFSSCDQEPQMKLANVIMLCSSVKIVSNDDLPKQICWSCSEMLDLSYEFRKTCEKSEAELKILLSRCIPESQKDGANGSNEDTIVDEHYSNEDDDDDDDEKEEDNNFDHVEDVDKDTLATTPLKEEMPVPKSKKTFSYEKRVKKKVKMKVNKMKGHICEVCHKSFSQKGDLQIHKRIHTGERPYTCDMCKKSFLSSSNLSRHKRIHSGDKPFCCTLCNKRFKVRSALKEHENLHTGTRKFLCKECGRSFTQKGNLKIHEMLHTGAKPHVCWVCGKRFALQGNLNDHLNIHASKKPHKCNDCGKAFTQRSTLKEHLKVHSGEKPFPCSVCGKSFAYRKTLKIHMNIHTGQKPHTCETCSKCFSERSHLKRHMKIHASDITPGNRLPATQYRSHPSNAEMIAAVTIQSSVHNTQDMSVRNSCHSDTNIVSAAHRR